MTHKHNVADMGGKISTTDTFRHTHQPSGRNSWIHTMFHRWPTVLGVAVAALTAFDMQLDAAFVSTLATLVVVMALVYVGAAVLDRRWSAWLVLLAGLPVAFVFPSSSLVTPLLILLAVSALFIGIGIAQGRLREPDGLPLQALGVVAFGVTMLAALFVAPTFSSYLVALGLFGHAAWDVHHYLKDRVVARSYSEFCGVLDLLLGATILIVLWL